jgi:flagellar motor component MotA
VCKIKKPVEIIFVSDFMTGGSIKYVIAGLVIMVIALLVFAIAFFRKYKKLTRRYEKLKQALDRPNHLELSENSSSTNEIFSFPSSRRSSIELPKLEDCEAQYIGHEDFLDKDHSA